MPGVVDRGDDTQASQLDYLPTVLGGSDGTKKIKCPDFLAIRLADGDTSRLIACIATRLKPNYDTMTLRLITEETELARIQKFIEFIVGRYSYSNIKFTLS